MAQVIIVSNRLPISVKKTKGRLQFYPSVGGLATGLASYTKDKKNKWVGWPGIVSDNLTDEDMEIISKKLMAHNCYPVFLTQQQIDGFYNGYSNSILWPFFHNLPVKLKNQNRPWNAYRQVNQLFAETVMGLSEPESTIWVHDYQLLLVPEILRAERPYDLVGFFLHIPFPPAKSFKDLPHAKSLLKGMLGSDLIGFHTDAYVQDFLDSCQELHVGTPSDQDVLLPDNRIVRVTDFPLGIDYGKFSRAGKSKIVQHHIRKHRKKFGRRRKVILTVDRLDPSKGLVERLIAYREFLQANRRLHKRVVMVMLAMPSRAEIEAYRKLKENIEQLVNEINATYGKRRWQPVHYMYQTVPFEELAALYRVADVAFIAPIKDGMNLVAKEYIASRPDKQGVLILSETAGAAQELTDALLVNPKRPKSLTEGLSQALTMPSPELEERARSMRRRLATNTVHHWKGAFMGSLQPSNVSLQERTKHLAGTTLDQMLDDFAGAKYPTLLLDYDGVLVGFVDRPSDAKLPATTVKLLRKLAARVSGGILVISGRHRRDLDKWLSHLPVTLAAEHGAMMRPSNKNWRKVVDVPSNWKKLILPVLQKYADKAPGAFVEEKECSVVWHYRKVSPFYAQKYSTILKRVLKPLLKPMGLTLYRGNMILEIKSPEANKGVAATEWIKKKHDFILAFGDDYTDEDTFAVLPESAYTVKVGRGKTLARYRVNSVDEVHQVLKRLAKAK